MFAYEVQNLKNRADFFALLEAIDALGKVDTLNLRDFLPNSNWAKQSDDNINTVVFYFIFYLYTARNFWDVKPDLLVSAAEKLVKVPGVLGLIDKNSETPLFQLMQEVKYYCGYSSDSAIPLFLSIAEIFIKHMSEQELMITNGSGQTALHLMVMCAGEENEALFSLIQVFVAKAPSALLMQEVGSEMHVQRSDDEIHENIPLHCLCALSFRPAHKVLIECFIRAMPPTALLIKNDQGEIPLMTFLIKGMLRICLEDREIAFSLIQEYIVKASEEVFRVQNKSHAGLIHYLCCHANLLCVENPEIFLLWLDKAIRIKPEFLQIATDCFSTERHTPLQLFLMTFSEVFRSLNMAENNLAILNLAKRAISKMVFAVPSTIESAYVLDSCEKFFGSGFKEDIRLKQSLLAWVLTNRRRRAPRIPPELVEAEIIPILMALKDYR